MTFAHYDIAAGAAPLHEHQHEQEEVWHIVEGEVALTIDGEEQVFDAGCIAVVPPHTPHSVRRLSACRAVIADYPLRPDLPGVSPGSRTGAANRPVMPDRLSPCPVGPYGHSPSSWGWSP